MKILKIKTVHYTFAKYYMGLFLLTFPLFFCSLFCSKFPNSSYINMQNFWSDSHRLQTRNAAEFSQKPKSFMVLKKKFKRIYRSSNRNGSFFRREVPHACKGIPREKGLNNFRQEATFQNNYN